MKKTFTKLLLGALLIPALCATAQSEFITRWNLATPGSAATTLTLGLSATGPLSYTWTTVPAGTSATGTFASGNYKIVGLPAGATIRVAISPTNLSSMQMGTGFSERNRLVDVEQWGTTVWTTMGDMFLGAANMQISATDVPNLSSVSNMTSMFANCTALNSPANINSWNTSHVALTGRMFSDAISFNQNIGSWNMSAVTDMNTMFYGATSFNQDISAWNVINVYSTVSMFEGATSFNQNIGAWNVTHMTDMTNMLTGATAFNQSLAAWAPHLDPTVSLWGILNNTGLSIANYDATLIAFNTTALNGTIMGAAGLKYCAATAARANMISAKGWSITGDAQAPGYATPAFAALSTACSGMALPAMSDNGISGTWSPASPSASISTYTFVPNVGQCAPTITMAIAIGSASTPAFAAPALACAGSTIAALPLTSTNGITGTWLPALNNMVTTNYTFTPDAGQCATTTTVDIVVDHTTLPVFTAPAPACSGSSLTALPLTSNNGITGTWLPALDNTVSTTYTFSPDAGQCANTNTLTLIINPSSTPTFTTLTALCANVSLPATADNGMTGVWSPTLTAANVTTYTFTPDGGQCAAVSSVTMALTVYVPQSTTTLNGVTITATETGASYQWIDCNNGNATIPNATNQSYTPTTSGNYAVIVTKNGCTSTSACQQVVLTTGINEAQSSNYEIVLSPNPNQGAFQISSSAKELGTVLIYNALGESVYTNRVNESSATIALPELPAGIYVVYVITNQKVTSHKMIIGH